ncbi:MAG: PAS domain S-box protein, partial [Bacteroidetes bacterium]
EMFELPREQIIGKTLAEDVSPEEREHFLRVDKQLLADGKESILEESLTVRGGATKTISTRKTRYIDEHGNAFLVGIIRDITERRESEELSRLNKLNELLLRAAQVLSVPSQNLSQALGSLTELVATQFDAVCDVSVLNRSNGIIEPMAVHHQDFEVREILETVFSSMVVKQGQGLVGHVIEKGEELLIQDVPKSMKEGPAKISSKIIPVSMMYVPLKGSADVIGSMNLTRLQGTNRFSDNDILQIRRIGQYISLFVENILLREEQEELFQLRRRSEQRLESEKRWTEFKLEVSGLLANVGVELEETLQRLCVRVSAFFEVVSDFQLVEEGGETIRLVALHHPDAKVVSAIKETLERPQIKVGQGMVGSVVQSGNELYLPEMPEHLLQKVKEQKVNPLIVPCSLAYIPLRSNGKVLGTLDLTRLSHQDPITKDELAKMRDLADYAASFIENRLLQRRQLQEIDLRKKTEKRLERTTKLLERMEAETRQMLNSIPVYIARITKDLRYLFLNDAYKQRGVEPRKLEGKHIEELLGKDGLDALGGMIARTLQGEVVTFEHQAKDVSGQTTYLSVALAPDYSEDGEVIGFYSCSTDITSQVIAEKTARLTQDRFESLSLNAGDAFFFHDEDQNILDVNQVATEMLGYSRSELLSLKAQDIDPKWSKDVYKRFLKELEENIPQTFETNVVAKDGSQIPVEIRFVKRIEDGRIYIQSLLRDRTEKRAQELRLERSEQRLRLIFDHVDDFIATLSENGTIETVNRTSQGVRKEDVIGGSVFDWYPDETIRNQVVRGFKQLVETGEGFEIHTTTYEGPDGTTKVYNNKYTGKYKEGDETKYLLIIRDVTLERDRERTEMNAVLRGQEQERKRLGAELHDGIGQVLSAIALQVSQIREDRTVAESDRLAGQLSLLNTNLQSAIREVRGISHDLMPEVLESFGLREAISQICNSLKDRAGLSVKFDDVDLEPRYHPALEMNLYRITQELMNNIQKHSRCKRVFVSLMDHGDSLNLTVEDDGRGFDREEDVKGIGLRNVRSRVALMGGQIDVESAIGSGTLINIEVPKRLL